MLSEEAKRKLRLLNIGEYIEAVEMQEKDPTTMGMASTVSTIPVGVTENSLLNI